MIQQKCEITTGFQPAGGNLQVLSRARPELHRFSPLCVTRAAKACFMGRVQAAHLSASDWRVKIPAFHVQKLEAVFLLIADANFISRAAVKSVGAFFLALGCSSLRNLQTCSQLLTGADVTNPNFLTWIRAQKTPFIPADIGGSSSRPQSPPSPSEMRRCDLQ